MGTSRKTMSALPLGFVDKKKTLVAEFPALTLFDDSLHRPSQKQRVCPRAV